MCHTLRGPQCAGTAIYRANVVKSTLPGVLSLPQNKQTVFATPQEFVEYHTHGMKDFLAKRGKVAR